MAIIKRLSLHTCALLICLIVANLCGMDSYAKMPPKAKEDTYVSILQRPTNSLLYRIEHKHMPPSYIFGTFHSDSPKLATLLAHATQALAQSKLLLVEIAIDKDTHRKAMQYLTYPANHEGLHTVIPQTLYENAVAIAAKTLKISTADIDRYKPWALAILMQYPPAEDDGVVLDEKLQKLAEASQIPIRGLETIESQLTVFNGLRPKDQISLLEFNLAESDDTATQQQALTSLYLNQDINGIAKMSDDVFAEMTKQAPEMSSRLKDELITKRNLRMMGKSIPYMRKQTVLIAVGALHLPGEDGILSQFEKRGFHIYPVIESVPVAAPQATDAPKDETISDLMKAAVKNPEPVDVPALDDTHSTAAPPAHRAQPAF